MGPYNGFSGEQRMRAQRWLNDAFDEGLFPRPTKCRACGQTRGLIDSHAEDYSEPFGPHLLEYPLCVVCHMNLHWRFRDPALWDRYRTLIAAGYRHKPVYRRAPRFDCELENYSRGDPPAELVLDTIGEPRELDPNGPLFR